MENKLVLRIEGMTCEHCAARIEDALKRLDVSDVRLDLEGKRAYIKALHWITVSDFESVIDEAGYALKNVFIDKKARLPVSGMSCDKCRHRITSALLDIEGVTDIKVNLDTASVDITGDADLSLVSRALSELGYLVGGESANLNPASEDSSANKSTAQKETLPSNTLLALPGTNVHLQIQGMSCASCVSAVEHRLASVPGVTEALVNFADETAHVTGDVSLDPLVSALQEIGYKASLLESLDADEKERNLHIRWVQGVTKSVIALLAASILMGGMWFEQFPPVTQKSFWLPLGLIVLSIMIFSGAHFYKNAWRSLTYLTTTMDTLIALGTGTAWTYSMLVVLMPSLVPEESRHLFFEAGLFIIGFVNLGKSLELNARGKASSAIEQLVNLKPDTVTLVVGDQGNDQDSEQEHTIPLAQVAVGDLIRVKPGEKIAVDGCIEHGFSSIDESMLSGESVPVDRKVGDVVVAGSINLFGSFVMRADQIGEETTLARMVAMVKHAQNSKPPIGRITDSIAAVFVPAVLFIAVACIIYWGFIAREGDVGLVVVTAMSVLIVACPCALGLAIPVSIMVGMGRAASNGLLVRNSTALQAAADITTVILDKTGTLTEGKPSVVSVNDLGDSDRLLKVAYSLEYQSEHPLAQSIKHYCEARDIERLPLTDFNISPGGGVSAKAGNAEVRIGNAGFLGLTDKEISEAGTTIYVSESDCVLGSFLLEDTLKTGSKDAVIELQSMGINVAILSGDNAPSTQKVAEAVGISSFYFKLSPEQKLEKIRALQENGKKVAMVGDGINDAPALGASDVGFAMGSGTDIAIESADVAILGNQLDKVVTAIRISRLTMRNIYQNLFGAFAYNIILIPIAAGIFYPLLINPSFAGLAMAMSSVTVVTNANRLRFLSLH